MRFEDIKTLVFFVKGYKRYVLGLSILSILFALFEGLNVAVLFPTINAVVK